MKLLIISPSFPPAATGEAEHCLQIASRMAKAGHEVSVLTNAQTVSAGPAGFAVDACMKGWGWTGLPHLLWSVRRCNADVVLLLYTAWLFDHHPMVTYLPTWLRWLGPHSRLVVLFETVHGASDDSFLARLGRKAASVLAGGKRHKCAPHYRFGTLLRDADAVVALGPSILSALSAEHEGLAARSLIVPPPNLVEPQPTWTAADRLQARQSLGAGPADLLLAYFGYVYPGKGVDSLLRTLQLLKSRGRAARLLMAGGGRQVAGSPSSGGAHSGHEAAMLDLAERLGVADRVVWPVGYGADNHGVARQLMGADVAVLPFDDGAELRRSSIAVVTAMGLPLVTTRGSGAEAAFIDGVNALMVAPRNAAELADAIERVADDEVLRAKLVLGANSLSRDWFSWDRLIQDLGQLFAAVCTDGSQWKKGVAGDAR